MGLGNAGLIMENIFADGTIFTTETKLKLNGNVGINNEGNNRNVSIGLLVIVSLSFRPRQSLISRKQTKLRGNSQTV